MSNCPDRVFSKIETVNTVASDENNLGAAPTQDHLAGSGEVMDTEACTHDELDHGICLYCGEDRDPNSDFYGSKADWPHGKRQPAESTATAPSVSEAAREIIDVIYQELNWDAERKAIESILTRITGDQAKRIAELEADKARLDFVEQEYLEISVWDGVWKARDYDGINGNGAGPREAIDAAMKEQP